MRQANLRLSCVRLSSGQLSAWCSMKPEDKRLIVRALDVYVLSLIEEMDSFVSVEEHYKRLERELDAATRLRASLKED
jgi:hypothetical protein